jgi:hypothetical protein
MAETCCVNSLNIMNSSIIDGIAIVYTLNATECLNIG